MKPFVRWLGGKRRVAGRVLELLGEPPPGATYREPFVGGGAAFFAAVGAGWKCRFQLADANPDLVALYEVVRDDPLDLGRRLDGFRACAEDYAAVRSLDPELLPLGGRAARAYYLNRCCVNGVWRVNRNGRFNVPFASDRAGMEVVDAEVVWSAHHALQGVDVRCEDYAMSLRRAVRGDRVYLDPPYLGKYTAYTADGWTEDDLWLLELAARRTVARGVRVVASLPDDEAHRDSFRRWDLHAYDAARFVSTDGDRTPAGELFAVLGA